MRSFSAQFVLGIALASGGLLSAPRAASANQSCGPGVAAVIFTGDECCSKHIIPCDARPGHEDLCCAAGTITTDLQIYCPSEVAQCLEFFGDGPFDACVPDIPDDAEEVANGLDDNCDGVGIDDEFCDGIDNDNDGRVDEDLGSCMQRFLFVPFCWTGTTQSDADAAVERWVDFTEDKSLITACGHEAVRGRKFWAQTLPIDTIGCPPAAGLAELVNATRDAGLVDLRDFDVIGFMTNQVDSNACVAGFTNGGGLVSMETGGAAPAYNGEYVVFAHEFGHILGLADEYSHVPGATNEVSGDYGCEPTECCVNPHPCPTIDGELCLGNFSSDTTGWSWQLDGNDVVLDGPNGEVWTGQPTGYPPFYGDGRCIMTNASGPGWDVATDASTGEGSHRAWCPLCLARYGAVGPKCIDTFPGEERRLEANGFVDGSGNVFVTYMEIEDGRTGAAPSQAGETLVEVRDASNALLGSFAPAVNHSEPTTPPSTSIPFWVRFAVSAATSTPLKFTSFQGGVEVSSVTAGGQPPVAVASDVLSECQGPFGSVIQLDGTASFDPDGDTLYFEWSSPTAELDDPTSATPTGVFSLGEHQVTLTVTDGTLAGDTVVFTVTVSDTTPPVISSVVVDPECLWPANHKLMPFQLDDELTAVVTDACDPDPLLVVQGVESDETAGGNGPDFRSGPAAFCLRSERDGGGDGREYTVHLEASDASGNASDGAAVVRVPHDASDLGSCASVSDQNDLVGDADAACQLP